MVASTFDSVAFPFTIGHEGAWGNDPHDRGNWTSGTIGVGELKGTKYGIAAHVYPHLDIKNLTLAQAKAIYKRDYAAKVAYDDLPPGVDVSVWDFGVNAGPARSLSTLRTTLSASVSGASLLAKEAQKATDKVALIKKYSARRLSFYQGLTTFARYGRGWSRRAAECEAISVKTWLQHAKAAPADIKKTLEKEGAKANKSAAGNAIGGGATGAGSGAGGSQHEWVWSWDWTTAIEVGFAVATIALVAYFIWKFVAHRDRAQAYAAVSKTVAKP